MSLYSEKKFNDGFTLLELMIAVAIVGILVSLAYPSYQSYVIRSNRADAQQTLLQLTQQAERFFTQRNSYGPEEDLEKFLGGTAAFREAARRGLYAFTVVTEDLETVINPELITITNGGLGYEIALEPATNQVNKYDGRLFINHQGLKYREVNGAQKSWSDRELGSHVTPPEESTGEE